MLPIMRRKMYAQIEKITYYHYEFLDEEKIFFGVTNKNELVEKNISLLSDEDFIAIIQSLEKENILKWKKKYINKFIIFDGDIWEMIIYFNNHKKRKIVGKSKEPLNMEKVLCLLQKKEYIATKTEEIIW